MLFIFFLLLGVMGLYWSAYHDGYEKAENEYRAQIETLKAEHATAALAAQAQYQTQLDQALQYGQRASRNFLATQAQLKHENQRLKDGLHEATATTPACTLSPDWLRHYRQALGVPAAHPAGAGAARGADDAAITTTAVLQHAIDYGHWCQANTAALTALQSYLKEASL